MKVRKPVMYSERSDGQQPDIVLATPRVSRGSSAHFIPGFARRRPIRAILLAAAVFFIPYSLARHQSHVIALPPGRAPAALTTADAAKALPMGPVAIESVSGKGHSHISWHPPIGMDRRNEALDRLTMDFSVPQTPEQRSGFQSGSRPATAGQPAPAEAPARTPGETPAKAPSAQPARVARHTTDPTDRAADNHAVDNNVPRRDNVPGHDASRIASAGPMDEVDRYLWDVYERSKTKRDSSGDFTWKDGAAAARRGLETSQYVIDGMDPDFRELLYTLGHAMDDAGLHWTILSGFRDDYRQSLASGYKAHVGNSFHGGSRATGGYGHGCAADIEASDGEPDANEAVWKWVDQHGEKFGIFRPMKGIDPAHVQPTGDWHDIAYSLRDKRENAENGYLTASITSAGAGKVRTLVDTRSGVTEAQFDCVRSHHHPDFRLAGVSHHPRFGRRFSMGFHMRRAMMFRRMHRFGRRRMVVDIRGLEHHAEAEQKAVLVAEHAGTEARRSDARIVERHAKAEASRRNRRDAERASVAEGGRSEKSERHPDREARVNADSTGRNAKLQGGKAPKVADRGHKYQQKQAAAENSGRHARAKSRVAERQDAWEKNDARL